MAAPTPIAIDAPLPPAVKRQYSFTDFSQNNPTTPPQGNRMDAEYDRINVALNTVIGFCSEVKQLAPALTSTPIIAGADLRDLEQDYAVVSQAWAEYMPDTIPGNILAVMNITGDHWSSRWWANRAAQLLQNWQNALPPAPANTARYVYVATLNQTVFTGPDRNASTLVFDPTIPQRTQVFRRGLLLTPTDVATAMQSLRRSICPTPSRPRLVTLFRSLFSPCRKRSPSHPLPVPAALPRPPGRTTCFLSRRPAAGRSTPSAAVVLDWPDWSPSRDSPWQRRCEPDRHRRGGDHRQQPNLFSSFGFCL